MENIGIKQQAVLGFSRVLALTVTGVKYRLFRSLITVVVVCVAIAFMMNIFGETVFKNAIMSETKERIAKKRIFAMLVSRISMPKDIKGVLGYVASNQEEGSFYLEAMGMGGIKSSDMKKYYKDSKYAVKYFDFFKKLKGTNRRKLIRDKSGVEIFEYLSGKKELNKFVEELDKINNLKFPTRIVVFKSFLKRWPHIKANTNRIRDGYISSIDKIKSKINGSSVEEALKGIDGEFGKFLRSVGFIIDSNTVKVAAVQAMQFANINKLEKSISKSDIRKAIAFKLDILPTEVTKDELYQVISNRVSAKWFLSKLEENNIFLDKLDALQLVELYKVKKENEMLIKAERLSVASSEYKNAGVGNRTGWLIVISMLVCIVGIANVMLMSITERSHEIATLKCIGALDSYIFSTVITEAVILGTIGGIFGGILGFGISFLRMFFEFGELLFISFPIVDILLKILISVFMGTVLAVLASVYPSMRAAKLAPIEAMRVE